MSWSRSVFAYLSLAVALAASQQGQDFFFTNGGAHFVTYQPQTQAQSQQGAQTTKTFAGFFPATGFGQPFQQSQSGYQSAQQAYSPAPSPFQLPPGSQYDPYLSAAQGQPFHTNQHLPQPFQHRQQAQQHPAPTRGYPFEIAPLQIGEDSGGFRTHPHYYEVGPPRSQPTPKSQVKPTIQTFYDVQHPQGLIDQLDSNSRWRQQPTTLDPPRSRNKRPLAVGFPTQQFVSQDAFVDQHLRVDDSTPTTPSTTTEEPHTPKIIAQTRRKPFNRGSTRARISTTTEFPEPEEEITPSQRPRSRYKNTRNDAKVKPTTYSPDKSRQRNRYVRPSKTDELLQQNMTALHEEFGKPIGRRVNLRGSVNGVTAPSTTTTTTKTTTTTTTTEEPSSSSTEILEYEEENEFDNREESEEDYPAPEAIVRGEPFEDLPPPEEESGEVQELPATANESSEFLGPTNNVSLNSLSSGDERYVVDFHAFADHVGPPVLPTSSQQLPSSTSSTSTTTTTTTSTTTPSTTTRTTTRSTTTTTTTPSTTTTTTTTTTPKPPAVTTIVEEDPEAPDPADLVGERAEHRDQVSAPPKFTPGEADPQTTETYPDSYTVVVASVHTSRSVSGARFLPSGLVNQEEKVKPLVAIQKKEDEKSSTSTTTTTTTTTTTERPKSLKSPVSTESIIDKLDRVHSELSDSVSGFSPGEDDQLELEVRKDMSAVNLTTTAATTTQSTTTTTSTTRRPSSERKFVPASRRTTPKPLKKSVFESIQFDDLTPGLLPNGFKLRTPKPRTFTTTTAAHVEKGMQSDQAQKPSPRNGAGRSTGLSIKNRIKPDGLAGLLPPGYKREQSSTTEKTLESILGKITFEDVSSLLPPGFEAPQSKPAPPKKLPVPGIKLDVPTNLLPPGYKPPSAETSSTTKKPETSTSLVESLLKNIAFKEVGSLLPPGYKQKATAKANTTDNATTTTAATTTVKAKVVLPTPTRKPLPPPRPAHKAGVNPVTPKIIKGWPVRASTEFTGWPSPPTTPISVEKILAAAKEAAAKEAAAREAAATTSTTPPTTTTTTTTTTTPKPTTPGICDKDCDMAATIKIVGGAKWVPELLDHNTLEYQQLANEVTSQLEAIYSSSDSLSRWYKKIRIDAFQEGSVIVDYFVELSELGRSVSTADLRRLFHESVRRYALATEPLALAAHDRAAIASENATRLKLGKFYVDPKYTDFIVLPRTVVPTIGYAPEEGLLPQWAIAVIVIGLASLLFVIIFGVTVLVNRQKSAKKKQPVSLTEDMLNELNKNHMGGLDNFGADDLYNMEDVWNEKPVKKRSSGSMQDNSMANLYDSWRSEWNGYYYNAYYGANGGSSASGYTPRRRSDYDTNF